MWAPKGISFISFKFDKSQISEQPLTRLVAHPVTHENKKADEFHKFRARICEIRDNPWGFYFRSRNYEIDSFSGAK
jgi:hypothetical protein